MPLGAADLPSSLVPQEAIRQLRERLVRDRDEAVERERLVGVAKAREAVERAEHAAEMQRLRTKADAEGRLEEMERCLREEVKSRDNAERNAKRVGMEQVGNRPTDRPID